MTIIVGNIENVFIEEVKQYLEDKLDCSVSIADNRLIGHINDVAVAKYTQEKLRCEAQDWYKKVFNNDFNWE